MILEPQEQFKEFLRKSSNILIIIPENPSGDAVASAWALYFFLEKTGAVPTIASANHVPEKYGFLPQPQNVLAEISGARDFVLSFDTSRNRITNIRTEEENDKFNIYLTPEKGSIDPRDFSFILAKFKYDLLITIDSPDLERLGAIYESNLDLFFEVPVVNIDRRSDNDNFGQINLVDVTASSCSEIMAGILESFDSSLIDKNIASCLLTGIISATDSFQKKNTTPRSLLKAAELMEKGADQQEIIRWLYKTQSFHVLKLWGRVMAKLNWDEGSRLVWSEIPVEDFILSRSTPQDLPHILEKLQENYSEGRLFMAIYNDTPASSTILIKTTGLEMLKKLQAALGGQTRKDLLEIKLEEGNLAELGKAMSGKIKSLSL